MACVCEPATWPDHAIKITCDYTFTLKRQVRGLGGLGLSRRGSAGVSRVQQTETQTEIVKGLLSPLGMWFVILITLHNSNIHTVTCRHTYIMSCYHFDSSQPDWLQLLSVPLWMSSAALLDSQPLDRQNPHCRQTLQKQFWMEGGSGRMFDISALLRIGFTEKEDRRLLKWRLNCLLVSIQTVVCLSVLVPW